MVMPACSARRAVYVVSGLARYFEDYGLSGPPLVAPVIEAYCLSGLAERHSATKGTYRSVLRLLSDEERPKLAPRFAGSVAGAPYSAVERAELYSIARSQRFAWRVRSALCLISLSMGAGLRTKEIVAARRGDLVVSPAGVNVRVGGSLSRVIPVSGEPAAVLAGLSRGEPTAYLFHPGEADRSYHNFVNNFCHNLVADPSAPKLSVARLRSSFVCDHLSGGTRLSQLLELTGIAEVESLLYYSRHVQGAPHSKALLRKALAFS